MFVDMPLAHYETFRPILRKWYTDELLDGCAAWLADDCSIQAELFETRETVFLEDYVYVIEIYMRKLLAETSSSLYRPRLVAP
jgi:hypothetical protein